MADPPAHSRFVFKLYVLAFMATLFYFSVLMVVTFETKAEVADLRALLKGLHAHNETKQ